MSILDFFRKRKAAQPQAEKETRAVPLEQCDIAIADRVEAVSPTPEKTPLKHGIAFSKQIELDSQSEGSIRNCCIAFDVETTGLNPVFDRIVEIGAVIFQNGAVHNVFSSLVNPEIPIPQSASNINHITNSMLASAPSEEDVYSQLADFLGDALRGKIIMCAHNAKFDFSFLCNTLSRLGFDADIKYVDTLNLSRRYLHGLENHKQATIENYFGLINISSYRAASDAENCGHILYHLMDIANEHLETERRQIEKSKPNPQELEICAFIQNVIFQRGGNTTSLGFMKNGSGYLEVCCLFSFLKAKFSRKGAYIIIRSNCPESKNYVTEPCTQSEGGTDYIRAYFSSPFDLEYLSEYIYEAFLKCYKSMEDYAAYRNYGDVDDSFRYMHTLTNSEVASLLNEAKTHSYAPIAVPTANKRQVSRNDIVINAIHNRVPLNRIRNARNWDKGFEMGYPHWEKGEAERKNGNLALAIELFDKARLNGYNAPALYTSYALAYRKLKDYDNEIAILDEGISRLPEQASEWRARRAKAINLLLAQQEKKAAEKTSQQIKK